MMRPWHWPRILVSRWTGCGIIKRSISTEMLPETKALLEKLKSGDRYGLSRSITLIESTRSDHRAQAELLLDSLLQVGDQSMVTHDKSTQDQVDRKSFFPRTFRIGIAGPPGAGKSTLIEAIGMKLVKEGHKVAVLAIDPSSCRTGGSILGDKTRMYDLSREPHAFVRPSPSRGNLGGLARATHEVMLLCEGSGYDVILVETVGLGQNETAVDGCVDMIWLVLPPGGGDELQGMKKGIVEIADLVIINKADGNLLQAAKASALEYRRALQINRWKHGMDWPPTVLRASAALKEGLDEIWEKSVEFRESLGGPDGIIMKRRKEQVGGWMLTEFHNSLLRYAESTEQVKQKSQEMLQKLAAGNISPHKAAHNLLETFLRKSIS